jgi:TonB family protein
LLHLLLIAAYLLLLIYQPALPDLSPATYVPSYTYHEAASAPPQPPAPPVPQRQSTQSQDQDKRTSSPIGIEKPVSSFKKSDKSEKSANTAKQAVSFSKNNQDVHLIGDKNLPKPLIKLIARALSARLSYPRVAIDLNIKGTSVVKFLIHPNGQVTQIQLTRSSGAAVLDQAALAAVYAMSPVVNVSAYLEEPKDMEVGIIFN